MLQPKHLVCPDRPTCTNTGAMTACLFTPSLMTFGKSRMILVAKIVVFVGAEIFMVKNLYVICFGRFIFQIYAGVFTVFVPKFANRCLICKWRDSSGLLTRSWPLFVSFSHHYLYYPSQQISKRLIKVPLSCSSTGKSSFVCRSSLLPSRQPYFC